MGFGYTGSILRINLDGNKINIEKPDDLFYRRYFGGRSFIAYFLLKNLKPNIDPLGPDNKLIFACGPVTGAPFSGSGRNSVGGKSPLTGAYGEAEAGGFWGAELKRAGFDAIIFEGKAKRPVYLWINDGEVMLRDASHLWGKKIKETENIIREELKDKTIRVAQIGPGGEKLVKYACIINDLNHVAGRSGLGAVMGSKNLKAIAVKGKQRIKIADPKKLSELARWMAINVDKIAHGLHTFGTGGGMDVFEMNGNLPINNFRDGLFPNVNSISAEAIKETVRVGMGTCFACAIRCKKEVKIAKPWDVDPVYGGPEYETLAALGSNCGVSDLGAVCKANELCQKYSIDTISTGASIAFAMECYENGLLTKDDTDGLDLKFGNVKSMVKLVEMIGERRGIGDLLAEGVKRASERIGKGSERYAIHVKGQELPMHEPRLKHGLGLGYCVSPTGADHVHNIHDTYTEKVISKTYDGLGVLEALPSKTLDSKKIRLFTYLSTWRSLNNSLVTCIFPPWGVSKIISIVNAVTGWNTTVFELMKVSERALNLTRIFNLREGFKVKDDWLPQRFFEPKTSGVLSDTSIKPEELTKAKLLYYSMRGWNEKGIPTKEKLAELDIEWAINKFNR